LPAPRAKGEIRAQFHTELKSKPFAPAPLFSDFVRAAVERSRLV
jgi:CTP synthase